MPRYVGDRPFGFGHEFGSRLNDNVSCVNCVNVFGVRLPPANAEFGDFGSRLLATAVIPRERRSAKKLGVTFFITKKSLDIINFVLKHEQHVVSLLIFVVEEIEAF